MAEKLRGWVRGVIALVCVVVIVYCQRKTGKEELGYMLAGIAGLLAVLFDYNYEFNHPKRDK